MATQTARNVPQTCGAPARWHLFFPFTRAAEAIESNDLSYSYIEGSDTQ